MNISWLLNGTQVQTNESVTEASYTNTGPSVGVWNITALASNGNGTAMQTWLWNVSPQETPALTPSPTPCPTPGYYPLTTHTPSPKTAPKYSQYHTSSSDTTLTPFYIFGFVRYENGDECLHPVVNIAIDTTKLQAVSSPDYDFFQFITTNITEGDIIRFNVTDGASYNTTIHKVNQTDINNGGIFNLTLILPVPALRVDVDLTPDDDPSTEGIQIINPDPNTNKTITIIANVTDFNGYQNITGVTANISGPSVVEDSPVSLKFVSNISATTAIYKGTFHMSTHSAGEYKVEVIATTAGGTGIGSRDFTYLPLRPAAPRIVAYAPPLPVNDTEGATRTFNITTDQTVNVSWLLNGTEVFNQSNVNESAYTNTSAAVGTWNVSAVVRNPNGTAMQTWIWNVSQQVTPTPSFTPVPSPSLSPSLTPSPTPTSTNITLSSPFYIFGWVNHRDGTACKAPFVKITNLNSSEELVAKSLADSSFYQLITNSDFVNAGEVLLIEASKDGMPVGNVTYAVNQTDIERGVIQVNINEGPDLVISESGTSIPPLLMNKTNDINVTIWNNGTSASAAFNISFYVCRGNETEYETETRIYDGLRSGSFTNVSFSWSPTCEGIYNISFSIDPYHEIKELNESNNNLTIQVFVGVPDFTVKSITFNQSSPLIGDIVEINATIANRGVGVGNTNVEFHDNKSIKITRTYDDYSGGKTISDTLTIPEALKIKVHFSYIEAGSNIMIYDKNGLLVEVFNYNFWSEHQYKDITNYWTKWCDGDTIRIESRFAEFTIDRYEAVLANERIPTLNAGNCTNIPVEWNLSDQYMGWALNGTHNITVMVDPHNQIVESDEENNSRTVAIEVKPSLDFAVVNVMHAGELLLNQTAKINVTLTNYGARNGIATLRTLCDDIAVNETEVSLDAGKFKIIKINWTANISNGGAGLHNISVRIDPDNTFVELNETNNTRTEQIFVNGTDLAVTNLKISCGQFGGTPCYCGKNESINVTLTNLGACNAYNFTVIFKDGLGEGNTSGSVFNITNVQHLNSSDSMLISVMWTPSEFGKHTITVSIPFDNTDNNKANNEQLVNLSVKPEYDFAVENVSVSPTKVKEGENVTISAIISNWGLKNGTVNVSFIATTTDFVGSKDERYIEIGRNCTGVMAPGENKTVYVTWRANITGGNHTVYAVVDPNNKVAEWPSDITKVGESIILKDPAKAGNNIKSCVLHVYRPQLHITNLITDRPAVIESNVSMLAVINNSGNETVNSTVRFYVEKLLPIDFNDETNVYSRIWRWHRSIPEKLPIRVHFKYIDIDASGATDMENAAKKNFIKTFVDDEPVNFIVKSGDVAGGQPIKVSEINFNTPCGECKAHNVNGNCIDRHWEDVWTEWMEGNTIKEEVKMIGCVYSGNVINRVKMKFRIDKYQVLLGNRTVTIPAGNESLYNVTWNTSLPLHPGENYTLIANVEDEVVRKETYLYGTDLAVADLEVNDTYFDGNETNITAVIANLGLKNATAFWVNSSYIYDYASADKVKIPINSSYIPALEAGNRTNISVPWNASRLKVGNFWKHDYKIKVEINPLNNTKYEEKTNNNQKEKLVRVKRSHDFISHNLSFVSSNKTLDPALLSSGENVTVSATLDITNLANRGGALNVSFYVDNVDENHEIGSTIVDFPSGNVTRYANITWYVWDFDNVQIGGNHTIIVVTDPDNEIDELNESNNRFIQPIHVKAPELSITKISFEPDRKEINWNESMNISVRVANYGDENATNASLVVYDCSKRHIENTDMRVYGTLHPGEDKKQIRRENAIALRMFLDTDIDMGKVFIRDGIGNQIELIEGDNVIFRRELSYYDDFHGWTPWIISSNITIEAKGNALAKVSKIYYLEPNEEINTSYITVKRENEIHFKWKASKDGERLIVATIDPENVIQEYNEFNNTFARYITVNNNTPDLSVNDIELWSNGTEVRENDIIRENDTVRITANIAGVSDVVNSTLRILVDDYELLNGTVSNKTTVNWTAKVGKHVIKVDVDYNNEIDETNETNNILTKEIYVRGAEVSGNVSWKSEGLHGTILFDPAQPYEEDNVSIIGVINNTGEVPARNFSVALLFDQEPADTYSAHSFFSRWGKTNTKSYNNATCIYVHIDTHNKTLLEPYGRWHQVLTIYDKNDTEVWRTDESCWIHVPGNTVKIERNEYDELHPYSISFYPVYRTNITRKGLTLNPNSSINVSITAQNVSAGEHTVFLFIDPEGKVPEDVDNKSDNIVIREMTVLPTRDFTITDVIPEKKSINDAEQINITANVTNIGLKELVERLSNKSVNLSSGNGTVKVYRNGTTKVRFVDYENETCVHRYYLNNSIPEFSHTGHWRWERIPVKLLHLSDNLSYLPVSPGKIFSDPYENLTIIHRPGVDAIKLNFSSITLHAGTDFPYPGEMHVFNGTGMEVLSADLYNGIRVFNGTGWESGGNSPSVANRNVCPGDTVFIYTVCADFNLSGYTTMKVINEINVTLNASVSWNESGNITDLWCESKNITALWNATAGEHNITVTIDPADETSELNETNNTLVRTVRVNATKDPEIVDLNYSAQNATGRKDTWHPCKGDNVTITAIVRNNGTERANFSAGLWMIVIKDNSSEAPPNDWNRTLEERSIPVGEETKKVQRIMYVKLLNHTNLSLAPGETACVNATWVNISVKGNPEYRVKAIIDPLWEIREINESNNDVERAIRMNYPDLTVWRFHSPTRVDKNASVEIKNAGVNNASSFNVSLELIKHEYRTSKTGSLNITNDTVAINITMKGASRIKVHFASLDTTGANSYIEIFGVDAHGRLHPLKTYQGEKLENEWTPWWDGDTLRIDYVNANFYIDGYACGNIYGKGNATKIRICFNSLDTTGVNSYIDILDGEAKRVKTYRNEETGYVCTPWVDGNTTIIDYANAFYDVKELWWKEEAIRRVERLNASKSTNITLLQGGKYERLMNLNVSVDPPAPDIEHLYGDVIEQREDNNTATALIYADLIPEGMNLSYDDKGRLKAVTAIIANSKTLSEDEGIIYPVYDFNVSLEVWNGNTLVYNTSKRIDENHTIYGGEELNVVFDVNESEIPANRTYNFTIIADSKREYSWGEIEEINDNNNEYSMQVGPVLTVEDIYTEPASGCNCSVGAVIKNTGNLRATNFKVRLIVNSTSGNETWDETIPSLDPNSSINWTFKYPMLEPNKIYNVTVIVDPDEGVEELNEGNNQRKETIGPDLTIKDIIYYSEKGAQREGDKLIVGENQTISVLVNNRGEVGAANFVVKIWINSTDNTVYESSEPVDCVPPHTVKAVNFRWTPPERGWYILNATVDLNNVVPEMNEWNNNKTWEKIKAGLPGYEAKRGFLKAHGSSEFNGGIIYTVGNTGRLSSESDDRTLTTRFGNPIPGGADIRKVILYVYPDWAHCPSKKPWNAFLPNDKLKVTFNGEVLSNPTFTPEPNNPNEPVDIPDATEMNASYATYYYDVTRYYNDTEGANNQAIAERIDYPDTDYRFGIAGMALLIVYKDPGAPLMRYWIATDRDLIYAKTDSSESTGFEYKNCTRKVEFDDIKDTHLANASLKTILVSYNPNKKLYQDAKGIADALFFNPSNIDDPNPGERLKIPTNKNKGSWVKIGGDIAITNRNDGWEYVDVHDGTNYAAIQSRGAMFGFAHAILKVAYPPDLEPEVPMQLKATADSSYDIPITIHNWGKSKAKDFSVIVSIDGKEVYNSTIPEIKGDDSKTINIPQKAPHVEDFVMLDVNVSVDPPDAAHPYGNVKELINNYGRGIKGESNGEKNNIWNGTVTVIVNPPGWSRYPGGGGGTGGGWGTGTGTGEGSGSGPGKGVAGGTGHGASEESSGSRGITGRLMKGVVLPGDEEAGGGGKGEFSWFGLLIRIAMLAVAIALVLTGYLHEKRRRQSRMK